MSDYFSVSRSSICTCSICGRTKLDHVPCLEGREHQLADMSDMVNQSFDRLVSQFFIESSELSEMGLARKLRYPIADVSRMEPEMYKKAVMDDPIYTQLMIQLFHVTDELVKHIEAIERAEKEHNSGVKEKLKLYRSEHPCAKAVEISAYKQALDATQSISTYFTRLVNDQLRGEITVINRHESLRGIADSEAFDRFIQDVTRSILTVACEMPSYQEYLKQLIGTVTLQEITQSYANFCLNLFDTVNVGETEKGRATLSLDTFMSVRALTNFFEIWVVVDLTSMDERKRVEFLRRIQNYERSVANSQIDYRNHLLHFIKTNALKRDQCEGFIDRLRPETPFMRGVLQEVINPYNHTLGVSLGVIKLEYVFRDLFISQAGFRHATNSRGEKRKVYDFLEFYNAIQPSPPVSNNQFSPRTNEGRNSSSRAVPGDVAFPVEEVGLPSGSREANAVLQPLSKTMDIRLIIYKQGDDIRVKKQSIETEIEELPKDYIDFTAIYFEEEDGNSCRAIFDHYSTSCHLTGTSEQIRGMIRVLNGSSCQDRVSANRLQLRNGELVSFQGRMEVSTRAMPIKNLLQEFFSIKPISRYFYSRSASTGVGKYVFVYTAEELVVPSEVVDYVNFHIENGHKQTTTTNVWSVGFDGDNQGQIIPFLSMFVGLFQMLENITYDTRRFGVYQQREMEYLDYLRRLSCSEENAMSSVIEATISKREVYTMLLRETGLTSSQLSNYEDRARPFPVKIVKFEYRAKGEGPFTTSTPGLEISNRNETNESKWRTFFTSVITRLNRSLGTQNERYVIGNPNSEEEFPEIYRSYVSNLDKINFTWNETDEITGMRYLGQDNGLVFNGYMFFAYPEKGSIYPIELKHSRGIPIPTRGNRPITEGGQRLEEKAQNSTQRNQEAPEHIREKVSLFTEAIPDRATFFRPQKDEEKFRDFVNKIYPPSVLQALLAQHLWDHSKEEIDSTLHKMNVFLHQDMLQNMMNALILCFVQTKEGYAYQAPRHNQWYAIDTNYDRVMFLFRSKNGQYQVALFEGGTKTTPMNSRMRNYIKSGLFGSRANTFPRQDESHSIGYDSLNQLLDLTDKKGLSLTLAGQLFDTNGKCVGIRVQEERKVGQTKQIMDLRINPQAPIMPSHKDLSRLEHASRVMYVTDVKTNVNAKFGKFATDARFTLIEKPTTAVRYRVTQIYERSREWKQRIYIFSRMVITHWFLFREYLKITPPDDIRNSTINDYVINFILPFERGRDPWNSTAQEIENIVVPEVHTGFHNFIASLERIYPNVFYNQAFHVAERELQIVRDYMERELDLIQTYPPEFATNFMNMRMDTRLLPQGGSRTRYQELTGSARIMEDINMARVKYNLTSNEYYTRVESFTPLMDPLSVSKRTDQIKKSQLIMTEVQGKLYFLRLTRVGYFEIACYICHMWKTHRRIMSYEETETLVSSSRKYYIREDEIKERSDNDEQAIRASGQNYQILNYTRHEGIKKDKIIPKEIYVAMLPLE